MKVLATTARSACFELDNNRPYYAEKQFEILLDGKLVRTEKRNVFSLFSLSPDTSYTLKADGKQISFRTDREEYLFNVRSSMLSATAFTTTQGRLRAHLTVCPKVLRCTFPQVSTF